MTTPGPWSVSDNRGLHVIGAECEFGRPTVCNLPMQPSGEPCVDAKDDARLIAAAPDLLAVLKEAKDAIASAWAALGDNLESQALGGKGIERVYAHDVQSQLRAAGERASVAIAKCESK